MSDRRLRQTEKVVNRVMKTAAKYNSIGKSEFETILQQIMQQVDRNTSDSPREIAAMTPRVIEDMPKEYGQLREEDRSMEAMIAYLYSKIDCHTELGGHLPVHFLSLFLLPDLSAELLIRCSSC